MNRNGSRADKAGAGSRYDRRASVYDLLWSRYTERTHRFLLGHAEIPPGAAVLDVGCGTGALEVMLLHRNPRQRITAVDTSARMLGRARAKTAGNPSVVYIQAAAESLPFDDGSFDVVVSASALHHIEQPGAGLMEMGRVLVPGAPLYLLDWCRDFALTNYRDRLLRRIDPAHVRCYSVAELRKMLAKAGFAVELVQKKRSGTYGIMLAEARSLA